MNNHTMKNENSRKVSVNGIEIHYQKIGNGDHHVLLMVGDFGSSRTDFIPQLEGMDKDKFTLIAWDPPGFGYSRPPDRDFNNYFRRDAETAVQLMKVLGIDKYSIMGGGDGGTSGMIIAAAYPNNVNKLVIWGTKAYMNEDERKLLTITRDEWNTAIKQPYINFYGKEQFIKLWKAFVDCNVQYDDICTDDVKRIKCPTFLLRGENDSKINREHSDYLEKNIKDVKVHAFFNGGHAVHYKYTNKFNTLVQEFLLQN